MGQKKKRLCLFAGFDKNGEIADYVIYYLKALAEIADVYYWGEFEASETEKAKIKPYCKSVYCKSHGKYDFGSWQELMRKIGREKIEAYDEVILANDSCYGPLFDLSETFQEMDKRECDFWGLSSAYNKHLHLQSYFVVFKKKVIQSDVFYDFFEQIKPEANFCDVCAQYEDRLAYVLSKAGFKFCSYIKYGDLPNHPYKDAIAAIVNRRFPLLKIKFFLGDIRDQDGVADWQQVIEQYTNYPIKLIEEDLVRRGYSLDEIDQQVKNKKSETPNFYPNKFSLRNLTRKAGKIILSPVIVFLDAYLKSRLAPYFFKMGRMNRAYRQLQQEYGETKGNYKLRSSSSKCSLKMADKDVLSVHRFDLELPLTKETNVLLIGNITIHNLASLELYDPAVTYLNNNWSQDLGVKSVVTDNLCGFNFEYPTGEKVYFEFILVQPLKSGATDDAIYNFIENLKHQMIFESVLVMLVPQREYSRYRDILQSAGMCPANMERGLVSRGYSFQTYYDKIKGIRGYKALIYKIK